MTNEHTEPGSDNGISVLLEPEENEWHPFSSELLKVVALGDTRYRVDCIPWFTRGINFGDVIEAAEANGTPSRATVLAKSGHSTFRITLAVERVMEPDGSGKLDVDATLTEIAKALEELGCRVESSSVSLHSIDVPPHPESDLRAVVRDLLDIGEEAGLFLWEEITFPEPAEGR